MQPATKYKITMTVLIIGFVFWVLLAAVAAAGPATVAAAVFGGVLAAIFGLGAFSVFRKRRRELSHGEILQLTADLLKSYGRVSIEEAAKKLGKTEVEMEALVLKVLHRGMVQGFVDPATHIFYYGASAPVYQPVVEPRVVQVPIQPASVPSPRAGEKRFCRECGNTVDWMGEQGRWHCPKCGNYQA